MRVKYVLDLSDASFADLGPSECKDTKPQSFNPAGSHHRIPLFLWWRYTTTVSRD